MSEPQDRPPGRPLPPSRAGRPLPGAAGPARSGRPPRAARRPAPAAAPRPPRAEAPARQPPHPAATRRDGGPAGGRASRGPVAARRRHVVRGAGRRGRRLPARQQVRRADRPHPGRLRRIDEDRPAETPRDARNVLIVGSDTRGDLAPGEGTQGSGDDFVTGQRSDTVILAHLYGDSDKAQLISFPRDSWVTIPAYTDPDTGELVEEHEGKLNSAFEHGGPALLIRTIEQLSGAARRQLRADRLRGLPVDGRHARRRRGLPVAAGQGEGLRHRPRGRPPDDPGRAGARLRPPAQGAAARRPRPHRPPAAVHRRDRAQDAVDRARCSTRSSSTACSTSPPRRVQVDDDTSIDDLRDLAVRFRTFDAGGVIFSTRAGRPTPTRNRDAPVGRPARRGRRWPSCSATCATTSRPTPRRPRTTAPARRRSSCGPEAVRVKVYNGAGVTGLGRQAYDDLAAVGFQMVDAPDNRGSSARTTTVYHGPDRADSARTLAAAIPGSRIELDPALDPHARGRGRLRLQRRHARDRRRRALPRRHPLQRPPAAPAVKTAAEDPCAV